MDVAELRAFLAVAEVLHFGKAAEQMHMAQPPLSRTIKRLEQRLGTKLFERNTRSVHLTASGRALVGPGRDVLDALRRAELAVRAVAEGDAGLVSIAFGGVATHRHVAHLARTIRAAKPGIELEFHNQSFARPAMQKLVKRETDVILGLWDSFPPEITARVVQRDSLAIAMPESHPLAEERSISFERLIDQPFVSLPSYGGSVLVDRLRRLAEEQGTVPEIAQVAPDTSTALALVSAGVGCLLTLASVENVLRDPHVAFVAVDEAAGLPDVHVRVAWRHSDDSPALRAVLDILFPADRLGGHARN